MKQRSHPHGHRRRRGVAVAVLAVLAVAATVVGLGRAGSVRTGVTIQILPHVLKSNAQTGASGFLAVDFTNAGPSTVNHVFETITATAPAGTVLTPTTSDCSASGLTVTCNIGQVAPGVIQRQISFALPASAAAYQFSVHVSVAFDEGKQNGLVDTVTDDDAAGVAAPNDPTRSSQCLPAADVALSASNATQQTTLNAKKLPTSLAACTPGDTGVDPGHAAISGLFGDTSFAEFLAGNGPGTVKISLFSPPSGVNKNNVYFVEYANYPDLTPTANGKAVPKCATDASGNPTFPANSAFRSCVISIANISGGGLVGTLLVQGGTDPGWGTGQ